MDSWKEKLIDYEFMLWDTKRFDINSTLWTQQAFETQLYACAADYIRLFAIYQHGGIYLDMDMEVVKSFDPLLNTDVLLARENHISENLEAGCFGAEKEHPYIKKCMEYFETTPLFNNSLLPQILKLKKSERHTFVNPMILPEIMKNALEQYPLHDKDKIFSWDYFTAKNVVNGNIEATENTYTIHHFATQYHSKEWRIKRELEQKVYALFGDKTFKARIIIAMTGFFHHLDTDGFGKTIKFYFYKKILRRKMKERT
jgi:hypothetical protein